MFVFYNLKYIFAFIFNLLIKLILKLTGRTRRSKVIYKNRFLLVGRNIYVDQPFK